MCLGLGYPLIGGLLLDGNLINAHNQTEFYHIEFNIDFKKYQFIYL